MAPDAKYHVFAWWEPVVGQDAIRAELLKQGTAGSGNIFEFLNFASVGQIVSVERTDWFTVNDKHADLHVVGVFDFDDDGKITSWRDHYDSAEIKAKVGRFTTTTTAQRPG